MTVKLLIWVGFIFWVILIFGGHPPIEIMIIFGFSSFFGVSVLVASSLFLGSSSFLEWSFFVFVFILRLSSFYRPNIGPFVALLIVPLMGFPRGSMMGLPMPLQIFG